MIGPDRFAVLNKEWDLLRSRCQTASGFQIIQTGIGHGTLLTEVYVCAVAASKPSRRAESVRDFGTVVHQTIADGDAARCAEVIACCLDGLHFKVGKGYIRDNHVDYYIRPDWPYWHSEASA